VREAVALGLRAREDAKIKVRQPLAKVVIRGTGADKVERLKALIADELNVKDVLVADAAPGEGTSATEDGMTVTVDTAISEELRAEGWAREVIRAVQNLRRRSGLQVSDRIRLGLECSDDLWSAIQAHLGWIAAEVLAVEILRGPIGDADGSATVKIDGEDVTATLKRE
jgi:isoleucyl-tRNA synthetase